MVEGGTKMDTFYNETPKQPDYFIILLIKRLIGLNRNKSISLSLDYPTESGSQFHVSGFSEITILGKIICR